MDGLRTCFQMIILSSCVGSVQCSEVTCTAAGWLHLGDTRSKILPQESLEVGFKSLKEHSAFSVLEGELSAVNLSVSWIS